MDQQLNNRRTEILGELLANPAYKDNLHAYNLEQLIKDFPQSGLLHALLLYTGDESNLQRAAAYYDPRILYKLSNITDNLPPLNPGQIIDHLENKSPKGFSHDETPASVEWYPSPVSKEEHEDVEHQLADTAHQEAPVTYEAPEAPAHQEEIIKEEYQSTEDVQELPLVEELHTVKGDDDIEHHFDESGEETTVDERIDERSEDEAVIHQNEEHLETADELLPDDDITKAAEPIDDEFYDEINLPVQPIDDEVYDEIVSIDDIDLGWEHGSGAQEVTPEHAANSTPKDATVFNDRKVNLNDEEEKLILNNIAATDFFAFDQALERKKGEEAEGQKAAEPEQPVEAKNIAGNTEHQDVSIYHDEKMPYSFMWWLSKTRMEYSGIYQPYTNVKPDASKLVNKNASDELQHQYYENIFHLTSVEELERSTGDKPVEFDNRKKEDEIIERFIHDVPQIKPQSSDKLDNENKAKGSAEDKDELVTETLAGIYADQMLYHKAIATYKKLMLKFPEKSRYFASQIEQLEKKTN